MEGHAWFSETGISPAMAAGYKKHHESGTSNFEEAFPIKHEKEGMNEEVSY